MSEDNSDYSLVINIVRDVLGEEKTHYQHNNQIAFDCPVCSYDIKGLDRGDGKGNLEVNYEQGVYKCWSCGETHETHGSLYKLISKYGNRLQLRDYQLFAPEYTSDKKTKRVYKKIVLPKEIIYFSEVSGGLKLTHFYKRAYNYLKKRNISDLMIQKHKIGFCYEGEYSGRIIIPSYSKKGFLNYFVSRVYEERVKPKYKNPEAEKEKIIWNRHSINWDKPIYLVEGVFDHIFLPNSIPLLGKKMSDKLFHLVYKRAKKVVVILDGDAWFDTEMLYKKLNGGRLMGKVWYVKLEDGTDIADLRGDLSKYEEKQFR